LAADGHRQAEAVDVGRQKRLTLDGDHFTIDLVFYNTILRCTVLVDLKIGKLTHQDIGQMQMVVNYYDRRLKQKSDNPTVGLILCGRKKDAVVRYTLPRKNKQIFASKYKLALPSEEELRVAKENLKGSLMLALESTSSRMSNLARQEIYFGRQVTLAETLRGVNRVGVRQVHQMAADLLRNRSLSLALVGKVGRMRLDERELRL